MKKLDFTGNSWSDYLYWQNQDKKTVRRVNKLIEDIDRNGYSGIGKPEPLKGSLQGYYSPGVRHYRRLSSTIKTPKKNSINSFLTICMVCLST
jgi:toxin YoeB